MIQADKTHNITSGWTLFLKYFVPTIWIIFFGTLSLVFLFSDGGSIAGYSPSVARIGVILFLITGISFLYFFLMNLKRVELNEEHVYVTNYIKVYRYPYSNIERMEERDWFFFHMIHIHFREPGKFGKKVRFLANRKKLNQFLAEYPSVTQKLMR